VEYYRAFSRDNLALEQLYWLVTKGDTIHEMWSKRSQLVIDDQMALKETYKYSVYDRLTEVAKTQSVI
jgi:hypothetical protein